MENAILSSISKNRIFKDMDKAKIESLLSKCRYSYRVFDKNQILISEREVCENMGFVITGQLGVYKTNPSGNNVLVRTIFSGDHFGEGMIFSTARACPSTIITLSDTHMLFISREDILYLCELDRIFLKNMLATLSDKVLVLNEKIKTLSYPTIRQKLASFLLNEYRLKKSRVFKLQKTREEIGTLIGATRPSVSRELSNMSSDGLIGISGKSISLENIDGLRRLL